MDKPKDILKIFEKYTPKVEKEIKSLLDEQNNLLMYDMMSYFFGFLDEDMKKTEYYGGKRFFCCHTWKNLHTYKHGSLVFEKNECIDCGRIEIMTLIYWKGVNNG